MSYNTELFKTLENTTKGKKEEMINSCNGLVISRAKYYKLASKIPVLIEDLLQAGSLGVIYAYNSFDPSKNIKFITHAYYWINREIMNFINITSNPLKVEHWDAYNDTDLKECIFISKDQLSDYIDDTVADCIDMCDVLFKDFDDNSMDSIYVDGAIEDKKQLHKVISESMSELTIREKKLVCCLYGLAPYKEPTDIKGVSKKLNINVSVVEDRLGTAMEKIKNYFNEKRTDSQNKQIVEISANVSKYKDIINNINYLSEEKVFSKGTFDDYLNKLKDDSCLPENEVVEAIHFDMKGIYKFVSERNILGNKVVKTMHVTNRYKKHFGTVSIDHFYKVYDKDGNLVKGNKLYKKDFGVKTRTFSEFLQKNRVNLITK